MENNKLFDADEMERLKNIPDEVLETVSEDDFDRDINFNSDPDNQNNNQPEEEPDFADELIESLESGDEVNVGELLDAETAVDLLDTALSAACAAGGSKLDLKAREGDYNATAKEKKTLVKVTEKFLLSLKVTKIPPALLFFLAILIIYGSKIGKKYVDQKMLDDAEEKGYQRGRAEIRIPSDEIDYKMPTKNKGGRPKGAKNKPK